MSARSGGLTPLANRDLNLLAPKFRLAVEAALVQCQSRGYEAIVFEGYRTQETQAIYYARGRTVIPPTKPVTNAPTNLTSWHGYGLAVDVVHRTFLWTPPQGESWFREVAAIFNKRGCRWGGEFTNPDPPHMQWGLCKPSPSQEARDLLATEGFEGVWRALSAI